MNFPLFALALGAFAIGTTEFTPMGLLPLIASDMGVTIPTAGLLISAYAIGVMVGAPLMTLLLSPVRRKKALMFLMLIFTIGNLLSSIASDYDLLVVTRVVTSMAHGAFFGLGSLVAASLVPKEKQASAVAMMFMGLTVANIGGVPTATWVGHMIGWRAAFAGTAVLGVLAMLAVFFALPKGEAGRMPEVKKELKVLVKPTVLNALLSTVLGAGAMFTLYTYIAAVLDDQIHASPDFIAMSLVVVGIGFSIGNMISGKFSDISLKGSLLSFFGMLAIIMMLFPVVAKGEVTTIITLLLWGIATFAVVPPLQIRVMQAAHDAPSLASSVNIGAFNLGNALGAVVGNGVLNAGFGYAWVAPMGGVLAVIGFIVIWAKHK